MKNTSVKISTLIIISLLGLIGCSGGGSSEATAPDAEEITENKDSFNPDNITLTQSAALNAYGTSQIMVELKNLVTDDPVYITATSNEQENGQLTVKPHRTIINPNEGYAAFSLSLSDTGVTAAPNLKVTITTSGNTVMQKELLVELAQ